MRLDLQHQRYVYGGSTITQQLVKNLILDRRKTLKRKFHELLIADRVYQKVPKSRVLELYVNVIEFGPGVYGIKEAADFYFQKTPSKLSVNEAIFLAMLKPDPVEVLITLGEDEHQLMIIGSLVQRSCYDGSWITDIFPRQQGHRLDL